MRRIFFALFLALTTLGLASQVWAVTPCCGITAINLRTGEVTARETATGRTFAFKVANPGLLNSLKVGQAVYANFATKQVSINGEAPCCTIVSTSATTGSSKGAGTGASPAEPCCSIASINLNTRVVSATETATGKSLQFKVANAALLNSLRIGQPVYANFATHQVSVDGITPCCGIVSGSIANSGQKAGNAANPLEPCCGITSIDAQTGVVTATEMGTGKSFQFRVANAALLNSLKIGQPVYANFATHQVSVDRLAPCCSIISGSMASSGQRAGSAANPLSPCCNITSFDLNTGLVTASETASGRTFQFKVANAALLNSLKIGQPVYANFATHQVSVDRAAPCCGIISSSVATGAQNVTNAANPLQPCCNVASVDLHAGVVTATEVATGRSFQFKAGDTALLNSLKIGQPVYANFATHEVSVDGIAPCCGIIASSASPQVH